VSRKKITAYSVIGAPFAAIPIYLLEHEDYWEVSPTARDLLVCLASQFNAASGNNGDLCAAQSIMSKYGWADSTRKRALKRLEESDLLVKTRQGHKRRCSLYALSWLPIDECEGKGLEINSTKKPYKNYRGIWHERKGRKIRF
jgi:hypothetical protein